MKVKTVEVARKFNLGNYETQDIKLGAELEEGDDVDNAIGILKTKIKLQAAK